MPFVSGNVTEDFWDQNPQLKFITPFSEFHKKKNSSNIMWAIYQIHDPKSVANYSGMTELEVVQDVNANFLGDVDFDWGQHLYLVKAYKEKCISTNEKLMIEWEKQLLEFDIMLGKMKWDPKSAITKTNLMKNKKDLWADYDEIRRLVLEERSVSQNYANYQESVLESGDIFEYVK